MTPLTGMDAAVVVTPTAVRAARAAAEARAREAERARRGEEEAAPSRLNPTQGGFAKLVEHWFESWVVEGGPGARPLPAKQLHALLSGTVGTGKTTCLKAAIDRLGERGFRGVVVAAPAGVAADSVGMGARTLHDLSKLHEVNPTSRSLSPLEGRTRRPY